MQTDFNGLDVTLSTEVALDAWDATQKAFLAHGAATPDHLGTVLGAEPGFALGWAVKGLFYSLLGRRELRPTVAEALETARSASRDGGATARERRYIDALDHYYSGRQRYAAAIIDGIARDYPGDALAMKLAQAIRFIIGDTRGMLASVRLAAGGFADDHPARGYLLGCESFALEECGDYTQAERFGRAGLDLCPDDAWGLHAVAHVHDMTGRAADGVRWLAGKSSHWAHCNNFGFHVWWHLALFHLDRGAFGPVLALYDLKVRPAATDDFRDISNAASLLLRLEIEGVDVGDRWDELADLSANRVDDGSLVFADLHYLMALMRTDRGAEAEALTRRIARDATTLDHDQHEVSTISGAPIAEGLLAFRGAQYDTALPKLVAGLEHLPRIGGSHAQRDVFWRLTVEAALRGGDCATAEVLLARRTVDRGFEDGYTSRRRAQIETRRMDIAAGGIAAQ